MTIGAVEPQRRGKEAHCPHELIHRNAFQDLYVLEDFFCHGGPLAGGTLSKGERNGQEPQHGYLQPRIENLFLYNSARRHFTNKYVTTLPE